MSITGEPQDMGDQEFMEQRIKSLEAELESNKKAHWACSVERTDWKAKAERYEKVLIRLGVDGCWCDYRGLSHDTVRHRDRCLDAKSALSEKEPAKRGEGEAKG